MALIVYIGWGVIGVIVIAVAYFFFIQMRKHQKVDATTKTNRKEYEEKVKELCGKWRSTSLQPLVFNEETLPPTASWQPSHRSGTAICTMTFSRDGTVRGVGSDASGHYKLFGKFEGHHKTVMWIEVASSTCKADDSVSVGEVLRKYQRKWERVRQHRQIVYICEGSLRGGKEEDDGGWNGVKGQYWTSRGVTSSFSQNLTHVIPVDQGKMDSLPTIQDEPSEETETDEEDTAMPVREEPTIEDSTVRPFSSNDTEHHTADPPKEEDLVVPIEDAGEGELAEVMHEPEQEPQESSNSPKDPEQKQSLTDLEIHDIDGKI